MRTGRSCEFDRASDPKVRPPANRARPYDRPTMNLALARVNAARHQKPTAGELVDPPVLCGASARQLRANLKRHFHRQTFRAGTRPDCENITSCER